MVSKHCFWLFFFIWIVNLCVLSAQTDTDKAFPLVIGHRGAAGHRPEHTLASYELAIEMGVDYVEPDVVSTRDGVLICRHENDIGETTDVAQKFPDRKKTKIIDGKQITGWFTEDFTLAEIKTLRAKERLDFRSHQYDGLYEVPTLQEMICLVKAKSKEKGRIIGIYPETKHPTYHAQIGLALEEPLLQILKQNGFLGKDAPVFIQSFEIENLKRLSKITSIRLIQLIGSLDQSPACVVARGEKWTYRDMITPDGLKKIAEYAYGIGPNKIIILPCILGKLTTPTSLVNDAHNAGLKVHIYTLRNEHFYLPLDYAGNPTKEYEQFFQMGVDGIFTDFPDTGIKARTSFFAAK